MQYDKSVDPVRSAVIWPEVKPVVSRNMVKTDPVSRYQSYQQEWAKSKVPEEKKHKELRWAVREQMLYKDVIYEVSIGQGAGIGVWSERWEGVVV